MRAILAILYCSLALAIVPFTQVVQVSTDNSRPSFDSSKPYALVVGDGGHLFVFDGRQLFEFTSSTAFALTQMRWRHDGAYALAVGYESLLLKLPASTG